MTMVYKIKIYNFKANTNNNDVVLDSSITPISLYF